MRYDDTAMCLCSWTLCKSPLFQNCNCLINCSVQFGTRNRDVLMYVCTRVCVCVCLRVHVCPHVHAPKVSVRVCRRQGIGDVCMNAKNPL